MLYVYLYIVIFERFTICKKTFMQAYLLELGQKNNLMLLYYVLVFLVI